VSTAIRKLELCARLLNDDRLSKWCAFHLGAYAHELPYPPRKLTAKYERQVKSAIAELNIPVSEQEILYRLGKAGGGFESIEWIEERYDRFSREKYSWDGTYDRNALLRTIRSCANAAAEHAGGLYASFAFGDIPRRQFEVIRERVDDLLLDICPDAVEKFMSAYQMLGSKSSEDWSLALTACRRVIKAVADALFPPTDEQRDGRKLGEEQYINRLWAFLDDHLEAGSDKDLAKAHVDYLGSFIQRLHEKTSKGVHVSVTYEEAVRAVLYTYLTLGDILEFAVEGVQRALSQKGTVDVNSASYEELRRIPGISSAIAKEIIKRRAKSSFGSVEQLLEIKGFGPKSLEKVQPYLVALPKKPKD
jgi:competence ComEA-like helix-hairpin-helix protein